MRWRLEQAIRQRMSAQRQDWLRLVAGLRPSMVQRQIDVRQQESQRLAARLQQAGRQGYIRQQQRIEQALGVLSALSPQRVLERGYSLVEAESGLLWRAVALQAALAESDRPLPLRLHFGDGVVPIEAKSAE